MWTEAKTYVLDNLAWLVPVVLGGLLVIAAISVLVLWLSSRGRFMFLDNVVTGRAEVAVPWRGFAMLGNSLFRFRLLLAVAAFLLAFPPAGVGAFAIIGMVRREEVDALSVLLAVGGIGLSMVVSLAFLVIEVLTTDFVVPVMWQRGAAWRAAWAEVFGLVLQNSLRIGVYLLFRFLMSVVIGLGLVVVVLLTCCVAGCLLALPYVGTVVLLPVLMFQRAYSLHYLSQYGPNFDVFQPRPAAV